MCDFFWITVRDLDGAITAEDQFGPDSDDHVPVDQGCTCGMWQGEMVVGKALLELLQGYLKDMPYGTLTIARNP